MSCVLSMLSDMRIEHAQCVGTLLLTVASIIYVLYSIALVMTSSFLCVVM